MRDGTRWTIDSMGLARGGWDNDYLANARAWASGCSQHDDADALARVVGAFASNSPMPLHIVGHGTDGMIGAGDGYMVGPGYAHLSADNVSLLKDVKGKLSLIVLWGCHIGAGKNGRDFLEAMAEATGAISMAPTGWVKSCPQTGLSLIEGARWQVVVPFTELPEIVEPPEHAIGNQRGFQQWLDLQGLDASRGLSVSFSRTIHVPDWRRLDNDKVRYVMETAVDFSVPVDLCPVGARITGKVKIECDGRTLILNILNNRALELSSTRAVYYATGQFKTVLDHLSR